MIEAIEEERLPTAQRLHHRFIEASARVRGLKDLIAIRQASGEDFTAHWRLLQHAEAEKDLAHAELAKMGVNEFYHGYQSEPPTGPVAACR
jgi:hypothetical protein